MGGDGAAHAGVDHDHVIIRGHEKNDGVVDGVPPLVQEGAVHAASRREGLLGRTHAGVQVVGEAILQQIGGPRPADREGGHVAGVEDAGSGEHGQVFILDRGAGLYLDQVPARFFAL